MRKERIVVITTNLGISPSSFMLRDGRRRYLVISCLVFTSKVKRRGHSVAQTGPAVLNLDRCYSTQSTSPTGLLRLGAYICILESFLSLPNVKLQFIETKFNIL